METFSGHLIPPPFSPSDDLSFADCVLYPPSEADLAVYNRTSNLRQQLSKFEDSANGSYFPSSYPGSGPTSVYGGGNGANPYIDTNETFSEPISDKFVSCFTEASTLKPPTAHARTGSSVSGGYTHSDAFASPWTAHLSTPGLGSPSSSSNLDHLGCYMSPPAYTSDEFMIQPGDQCMYPSPADLASVALPEVQLLPDQQPIDGDIHMEDQALPPLLNEPNKRKTQPATQVDDVSAIRQELARSPKRSPPTQRKATTDRVHKPKSRASAVHHQQRQSQVGSQSRKGSGPSSTSPKTTGKAAASNTTRSRQFKCSFADYGCDSVFSAKNEWKRHVGSQHLQLGFYRCDVDKCNVDHQSPNQHNRPHHKKNRSNHNDDAASPTANDFNRKDLFTSHLRRMHAPWAAQGRLSDSRTPSPREREAFERSLNDIRERCWYQQRQPPLRSQCGVCGQKFRGEHSWDERMEHVGRHYERDEAQSDQAMEDSALREWAIEQNIILPVEGGGWLLASLFE